MIDGKTAPETDEQDEHQEEKPEGAAPATGQLSRVSPKHLVPSVRTVEQHHMSAILGKAASMEERASKDAIKLGLTRSTLFVGGLKSRCDGQ